MEDIALAEALAQVIPALLRAVEDTDLAVRVASSVTLLRTGPALAPHLTRIETLRALRSDRGDSITTDQVDADPRWEATLALIDGAYARLRLAANEGHAYSTEIPEPVALLDILEHELSQRAGNLLVVLDRYWGTPSHVTEALAQLGPAALPAMAHDYLGSPRFPIGSPTYKELVFCLEAQGTGAIAVYAEALEHWSEYERLFAVRGLMSIGRVARALSALRE